MENAEKKSALKRLAAIWDSCEDCPLHECNTSSKDNPSGKAQFRGNPDAKLILCGEALGEQESRTGLVFYPDAPAGKKLAQILNYYDLSDQALITNPVACRSTNERGKNIKPPMECCETCRTRFNAIYDIVQPQYIIAMGAIAIEFLTGDKVPVMKNIGRMWDTRYGPVISTCHPCAYVYNAKNDQLRRDSDRMWKKIKKLINAGSKM